MKPINKRSNCIAPGVRMAVGAMLVACLGVAAAQAPRPTVARLGDLSIGQAEVEQLIQSVPEAERAALKGNRAAIDNWLRQRLASEAVLREARSKGWAERPEVKARVDAATKEITQRIISSSYLESVAQVPVDFPSDAELAAAYEQGKAGFGVPAIYRVAQIFLATPTDDPAATAKVATSAKTLAGEAQHGDFANLARTRSEDKPTAERGGEVGSLTLAQLLPEVRNAVLALKVGEVSDAVKSDTGFHIVKLLDMQPARIATLQEMTPRLQLALRQQRQQQLVQAYLSSLAPPASVTIDSAALDAALRKAP
ncbi:peptidylprolyl isomerase [Variovorax ginsengisoli]|uniref:Peptidylprolyl isomerase n=1 Tax=Variovorax ginsengisoli TaxID=363844 RepID=A0ABT9SE21_9BURK|nr:peptidylprolyl isomerase [Variovorax ginsengisoli]MDP9902450.1 peptidylprolyl isomerase [Variovorax ginsengisoli]